MVSVGNPELWCLVAETRQFNVGVINIVNVHSAKLEEPTNLRKL